METQTMETCDCYDGVDRMINEGLGGGFVDGEYDKRKLEPIEAADSGDTK